MSVEGIAAAVGTTPLTVVIFATSLVSAAVSTAYNAYENRWSDIRRAKARIAVRARRRERRAAVLARLITAVAARLAGARRASDLESWLGDLVATSPGYEPLGPEQQVRYARGLFHAAVRMRAEDGAGVLGGVLDGWLRSDARVGAASGAVFVAGVAQLWADGGWLGVVVHGQGLVALSAAPWGTALVLRRVRGVEPVRRQRRRGDRPAGRRDRWPS